MTERLFESRSEEKIFLARVVECIKEKDLYKTVLDKTLFFPEGGGQRGDSGFIILGEKSESDFYSEKVLNVDDGEPETITVINEDAVRVSDTQEKNGVIYHFCSKPFSVGDAVTGLIDYDVRFRRMQNHTGEHIVSGLIHKHFGLDNVGFHMGSEDVTLDVNGVLSKEDLDFIEHEANLAVVSNTPVEAQVFSGDVLDTMDYRSKLDIRENVRIVTISGYDKCACCAPHVSTTGKIGIIKLTGFSPYKSGTRIHMLCGFDALEDYENKLSQNKLSCALLSSKPNQVSMGIERLLEENKKEKQESNSLKNVIASLLLEKAKNENKNYLFSDINDPIFMRYLATGGSEIFGVFGVFGETSENNYRYVAAGVDRDMRAFAKELNSALCGRGGGDSELVQGSVKASAVEIEEFFCSKK